MKIGIFGNVANLPYAYAQSMRKMGQDVVLIINRKELLYRPESYNPEYINKYPDWIVDCSQCSEWDYISLNPKIEPVLKILATCDVLFLSDLGPSLLPLLNKPAISFLPGSDLTYYADYRTLDVRFGQINQTHQSILERNIFHRFVQRQRDGILRSVAVRYFPQGIEPQGDELLSEIGVPFPNRVFQYEADLDGINPTPPPNNNPVRVYCPVRLTWKLPIEPGRSALDYKGSDIIIHGLGNFFQKTGYKLDIILMRKGLHIAEIEAMIKEENISDQVTWLDEMPLVEFRHELQKSDIILEQFGSSMIGCVGIDAMTTGRPVIGNLRPEILGSDMPVCHARTPDEICAQLIRLVFDPKERLRIGNLGREYVEKKANINQIANTYLNYLDSALSNQNEKSFISLDGLFYFINQTNNHYFESVNLIASLEKEISELKTKRIKIENTTLSELSKSLFPYLISGDIKFKRIQLTKPFQKETGFCWGTLLKSLEKVADNLETTHNSSLYLFEDDNLLGPAHSIHDEIRNRGAGRYSHWNDVLYFSTSDNSDPNTNGRNYQIVFAESPD